MSENNQNIPNQDKLNDTTQPQPQQNEAEKQVPKEAQNQNQNIEKQNPVSNEYLNVDNHSNNDEGLYDYYPDERPKEEEPDPNNSEIPKNQQPTFYDEPQQFKTQPEDEKLSDQTVIDQHDSDINGPVVQGDEKIESQPLMLYQNIKFQIKHYPLIRVVVSKDFFLFQMNQPPYLFHQFGVLGVSMMLSYQISFGELKKVCCEICLAQKNQNACFFSDDSSFQLISQHFPISLINKLYENLPNNFIFILKQSCACFLNQLFNEQSFDLYNEAEMKEQDSQCLFENEIKFVEQCAIQQEEIFDNDKYNESYLNVVIGVQAQSEF